ncbi:MAG: SDR family oxidoreductase [Syntrophobacterales bacterium]|jgi:NAD(P)-dependent dehydrogenase (short-subunit alcohol dehydrogenase family)
MSGSAVVTGGGNGIGKALCLELAGRGYRVVVADIALDEAEATVRTIKNAGGEAMAVRCDVTVESEVAALVTATISAYGPPDLVFSNAGAGIRKPAVEYNRDDLEWLFTLNVFGMWDVAARFAACAFKAGKAMRIVVTGSEHSIGVPFGGSAAYTATKHAILGVAEAMRAEWEGQPVDISILCPGLTQSRFSESERHREGWQGKADPMAAAVMAAGMPAETVARIAVDGAERGNFYIFTHSHVEEYARKRFEEIAAAFAVLNETAPSDRSYDVEQVVGELMAASREKTND